MSNNQMAEALREALSVCQSVHTGRDRRVVRDGCALFMQTEEWCKWAEEEVGAKLRAALVAHEAQAEGEREAFEAWYAEDANTSTGRPGWMTAEGIAALRDGDGYGEHRTMLNGKWEGWQARAALAQPKAEPLTDEQIMSIAFNQRFLDGAQYLIAIARAIEQAHGIGKEGGGNG